MTKRMILAGTLPWCVVLAVAFAAFGAAPAPPKEAGKPDEPEKPKTGLAAVVDALPDCDRDGKFTGPPRDAAQEAVDAVLKDVPKNIAALVGMLKEHGKGDDYKARYLLHAISIRVARPGAEEERRRVCAALASTLADPAPAFVKGHVIEELKWIGGKESAEAVSAFLLDDTLQDFAVQALVAGRAAAPMRAALAKAKGKTRIALVQGLGALRDAEAVPALLADAGGADPDLRLAALSALAGIGTPAAVEPLLAAGAPESPYRRARVADALLLLADRLAAAGEHKPAVRLCRHVLADGPWQTDPHVRCGALPVLARVLGPEAIEDILAAMIAENLPYRAAGFAAATAMPGEKVTEGWIARLKTVDAPRRAAILDLLGRRGNPAALPAALAATKDADARVRLAAITAAGRTGDERAVAPLVAALAGADAAEADAARAALRHVRGPAADAAIAKAVPAAPAPARAALIEILAAREARAHFDPVLACADDDDAKVKTAAMEAMGRLAEARHLPALTRLLARAKTGDTRGAAEKALAAACSRLSDKNACAAALAAGLPDTRGDARAALYGILAGLGNRAAFEAVRKGLADGDPAARDAALRVLAAWPDDAPAEELMKTAGTDGDETRRILALRGYIRMIGLRTDRPRKETLAMCARAMAAARRPDEKRQVLGVIGGVASMEALKTAQEHMQDKDVATEAAMAAVKVARALGGTHRAEAKAALRGVAAAVQDDGVRKQAAEALAFIEQHEDVVMTWLVSGAYRGASTGTPHPPERPDARNVKWKRVTAADGPPGAVDLARVVGRRGNVTAYLKAQVWSPAAQKARLEIGSDDGVKVWLRGKIVHDNDARRGLRVNEDKAPVTLEKGWNELLLKVTQSGGGWGACARVRAADGARLEGIRFEAR